MPILLFLLLWPAPQGDEAQRHLENGIGLYEEHDDSEEAAQQAEAEFRQALKLDPKLAPAAAYLGFLAFDRQQFAAAESEFRKALSMDRHSAEARIGLARLAVRAGHFQDSLRELRMAVSENPRNRLARRELGFSLTTETVHPTPEMWREAMVCWEMLVGLDVNDRDAHHELAKVTEHLGQWARAEQEYRQVLRIGQTSDDSDVWVYSVHNNVAEMLEKQGKYSDAIREYEALIASEGVGDLEIQTARSRIEALKKQMAARP